MPELTLKHAGMAFAAIGVLAGSIWVAQRLGAEPESAPAAQPIHQRKPDDPNDPWLRQNAPPRALPKKVELPAKGFDIAMVLGHRKREVDAVLGHNSQLEDGPWLYDGFEHVAVDVVFESGTAVSVTVQPPAFKRDDPDERAQVLEWMNANESMDFDHTHNFDFEIEVWAPDAQARQLHRRDCAKRMTDNILKFAGGYASSNYTLLTVVPKDGDSCSRGTLAHLRDAFAGSDCDLKAAQFDTMQCDIDGAKLLLK